MPALPVDVLAQHILRLSTQERVRLLDQVIASLEADATRDARWNALAAQRDLQAEADAALLVPAAEAMARIRTGLE